MLAAAGAIVGAVQGYVFVDAGLPIPGKTWMETVPSDLAAQVRAMADDHGWLPPWPRWWGEEALAGLIPDPGTRRRFADGCPPLPLAMFEEVHPPVPRWPDAPAAYLHFSPPYDVPAAQAQALGWPVRHLPAGHFHMLVDPVGVTDALLALVEQAGPDVKAWRGEASVPNLD